VAPPSPAFSVAVSREAGSGGESVAREVGRRLGWPVYDNELLTHLAEEPRIDVHRLEGVDERPGSRLVEFVEAFAAASAVTEVTYFRRLLKLLLALGARGACVIVGRGAMVALAVDTTLRVRVVASPKDRIAAVAREQGLNPDEAARYVEARDRERSRFIKDHYRKDLTDPLLYDLVLNASRLSVDESAALVIEALLLLQGRKAAR
jgi:cytidylate kinase